MELLERVAVSNTPPLDIRLLDRYWRAANYISIGQIYLLDNPCCESRSNPGTSNRDLGHWGTTPGLNFIYTHLNRVIKNRDLDMIYICGPGHGGPGMVANTWMEGTYSEVYPDVPENADGMRKLFRQFSFPAAYRAMWPPKTPAQSMRAANWVMHWCMPLVQPSTTRT